MPDFAGAVTDLARHLRRSRLRAASAARLARLPPLDPEFLLDTCSDFLERQPEPDLQIGTRRPRLRLPPCAAPPAAGEHVFEDAAPERGAENVVEAREDVVDI